MPDFKYKQIEIHVHEIAKFELKFSDIVFSHLGWT